LGLYDPQTGKNHPDCGHFLSKTGMSK
jgi:hypothetical protein